MKMKMKINFNPACGGHIVKLLIEKNSRITVGDRWMVLDFCNTKLGGIEYVVYQRKRYAKKTVILIQTQDEEVACCVLKRGG